MTWTCAASPNSWAANKQARSGRTGFQAAPPPCVGSILSMLTTGLRRRSQHSGKRTDPCIREEALAAADAGSLSQLGDWLGKAVDDLSSTGTENRWNEIRDTMPDIRSQEPWQQGPELARSVRSHLGIGQDPFRFESEGPLALFHSEHDTPNPSHRGTCRLGNPCVYHCAATLQQQQTVPHGTCSRNFMSHKKSRFEFWARFTLIVRPDPERSQRSSWLRPKFCMTLGLFGLERRNHRGTRSGI